MADTYNYKEYQKLSFKDIQTLLTVSEASAKRYLSDIKNHFEINAVLFSHFKKYFKCS